MINTTSPEVSVIIPVYDSEKYLHACLESILAQTLEQIEIICVDDGSKDRSPEILWEYSKADERVIVINKEHKGVSAARNTGIKMAAGKYIYFMDSDDLIDSNALSRLVERAEKDSLDITFFNGRAYTKEEDFRGTVAEQNTLMKRSAYYKGVYSGPKMMEAMYSNQEYWMTVWLQLYRRDFIIEKGLSFCEGIIHEDNLFTFVSILSAQRCGYIEDELYLKRIRPDSITTSTASFDHSYGYFTCFVRMKDFLAHLPKEVRRGVAEIIMFKSLSEAVRVYKLLDERERLRYLELPYGEQILFRAMVEEPAGETDTFNAWGEGDNSALKTQDENKALSKYAKEGNTLARLLSQLKRFCHHILPSSRYNVAWSYQHLTAQLQVQQQLINHLLGAGMRCEKELGELKRRVTENSDRQAEELHRLMEEKFQLLDTRLTHLASEHKEEYNAPNLLTNIYSRDKYSQELILKRIDRAGKIPYSLLSEAELLSSREDVLKRLNKGGIAAELGVQYGDFSESIQQLLHPDHFYAIDTFGAGDAWGRTDFQESGLNHEEWYRRRFRELIPEKLTMCKGKSWEVLEQFPDNYFDYIYIDASHAYENVLKDAEAAYKKVKDGGIIQFDDYIVWDYYQECYFGVVPAVNEFIRKTGSRLLYFCLNQGEYRFPNIAVRVNKKGGEVSGPECIRRNCLNGEPDVSVIVPIYNVEAYLPDCLESIISQTLKNIEIICVNDGSTDRSLDIALSYAWKDERISVYSQDNRGLSAARNTGFSFARGRYVHFTDSDDMLEPQALEKLLCRAEREDLEVVFCQPVSFCTDEKYRDRANRENQQYQRKHEYPGIYSGSELLLKMVDNDEYCEPVWLLLIKRDFYNQHDLSFVEGIYYEDVPFTFKLCALAGKAAVICESLYRRRIRENSITSVELCFEHVKGFFYGLREMEQVLREVSLKPEEETAFSLTIQRNRLLAKEIYFNLNSKEQEKYIFLPLPDRVEFKEKIIDPVCLTADPPAYYDATLRIEER